MMCALLLSGCPESSPSEPDAALPNTCGNDVLEQWEDCEQNGIHAFDGVCRNEPTCGNGVVDTGEVCDDGDLLGGDGCGGLCRSDETCGNGILDPGEQCDGDPGCGADCQQAAPPARCGNGRLDIAETCDPGDATDIRCDSGCQVVDATAMACGNGLLELGEQCDLGAASEPFAACDDSCSMLQAFLVTSLDVEPGHRGCDLVSADGNRDGKDCRVDNALGSFEALQVAMGLAFSTSLQLGGFLPQFILRGTADATGHAQANITAFLLDGTDGDADTENNADGGSPFWISSEDLGPSGQPAERLEGTMEGGWFELSSPRFALNIAFHPERLPFDIVDARIRGSVRHDGWRMTEVTLGWLCGAFTVRSLDVLHSSPYLDTFKLIMNLQESYESLLDIVVLSGLELGYGMLQPDVDVDGDGLETFYDDHPDDGIWQIDRCVDGDGVTEHRGTNCVLLPGMMDAFSLSMSFEGIWVNLLGVTH